MLSLSTVVTRARRLGTAVSTWVSVNGGAPVLFVVVMLVANILLIGVGGLLAAMGEPQLILAAGRAAVIIAPVMGAATAALAFVDRRTRA